MERPSSRKPTLGMCGSELVGFISEQAGSTAMHFGLPGELLFRPLVFIVPAWRSVVQDPFARAELGFSD
jgi:hypothetical protein